MAGKSPSKGRKTRAITNRNNVMIAGSGMTQAQRVSRANKHRERYNPVVGLTLARARYLIESYVVGEYADLMWTMGAPFVGVESSDPDLFALIERRQAALQDFTWHARIVDKSKQRAGFDLKLAQDQQAALYAAYDQIDNLEDAFDHLTLASFRGFSHLQKHRRPDGTVNHLEILDPWNVVRDGWNGQWKYNPDALQTNFGALPDDHIIGGDDWIIRDIMRPINRIALVKFIRSNLSEKDWDAFIESFGLLGSIVIGPPNVPTEKEDEYREAAERVAEGGSGYLPHGSIAEPNEAARGLTPYEARLDHLSEKLILAGTGGMLTMLSMPTGIGSGASDAHENTFRQIAKREAKGISSLFQRSIDPGVLEKNFPGKPRLVYFEIAADEETDPGDAVGHIVSLANSGYMTDPDQVTELTRYKVTREKAESGKPEKLKGPFLNRASVEKRGELFEAAAEDLAPLSERLRTLLAMRGAAFEREAKKLRKELPKLLEQINADPASAEVLAEIFGEEFLEGLSL